MNITSFGNGEPIIFLHGLVGNQHVFKMEVKQLSEKYKTISYDYLGHGSDLGEEVVFTIENLVSQLYKVYESEQIKKAHICALSFGCYIAHAFAEKYPDKVISICNIGGHYNNLSFLFDQFTQSFQEPINDYPTWLKKYAERVKPNTKEMPNPYNEKSKDIFLTYGALLHPSIIKQSLKIRLHFDLKAVLKTYKKPLLWISGEYDSLYRTCTYDLKEIIPHVNYVEIPDAGHLVNLNQSALFLKEYERFLSRLVNRKDKDIA
ncbi:alpha/beta fold hydrolase [Halalkalibacter nanhaiisediminis]|uniref:Pimeloyl-ACP methyl ester carboxylesterase n=1 Tax=Halalkalibacter nanhaiisediminis TaxID=688079 RepID=A0A562QQQ5_9BACI|nr:alpha/beta hydrolase [Halalkalibacter nanhaiisediminis]TWI59064.1 pimeloyl-ACP methyl ester carboxylesterase [Halalkalibacter nanhaiisediminis]